MGKIKRKRNDDQKDENKEEKINVNKETSVYVKSRSFIGMVVADVQKFVEEKGFEVVAIRKSKQNEYGLVDMGSKEKVAEMVLKLHGTDCKGSVVVASIHQTQQPAIKKTLAEVTLLDKLLVIKGVSKFVGRKTLVDVFKKTETIILPTHKGDALREALLLFKKAADARKAVHEFQGWELGGRKIHLEYVTSTGIAADVPLSIEELKEETANEQPKNSKSHKQQRNIDAKNKTKKSNITEDKRTDGEPPKKKKILKADD